MTQNSKAYKSKFEFTISRIKNFMKIFLRSKKGTFGLAILLIFGVISIFAPLLTPYEPTGPRDLDLAGKLAQPAWMRYTPWGRDLTENVEPIKDPGLTSVNIFKEFTYETNSSYTHIQHISSFGYQDPGCMLVTYEKSKGDAPNIALVKFYKKFYYPYDAPPAKFSVSLAVLPKGVEKVPVMIKVFVTKANGTTFEFGIGYRWKEKLLSKTSSDWIIPNPQISSTAPVDLIVERYGSHIDLAETIFDEAGNYTFGVEVLFLDTTKDQVRAEVYIDNIWIKLYGTCFGLLGTNYQGRDIFTQIVYGARISLMVGLLSAVLSVSIGLIIGLISGYMGGIVDEILMRFTDMLLVLPGLPLLIVLTAALGASIYTLIILLGFLGWMGFARVVRSQVLSLKERPFVEAVKAVGGGTGYIIRRHIIPNVMGFVYVSLALSVPSAIVSEAALSWLGYYDPYRMSWGRMLNEVQSSGAYLAWWWIIPPGLCIALISIAFIMLGYALDDILNPKLRERR